MEFISKNDLPTPMKLENLRREYLQQGLSRSELNSDPMAQFEFWMQQAMDSGLLDPTAMSIATVDASGQPSQRTVLLKDIHHNSFIFYTNLQSKKAQDIRQNNKVSLLFAWLPLERQIKIQGTASFLSKTQSFKYFSSRPKESQLAAWASSQSRPISSRQFLEMQFARMKEKFNHGKIPLPDFWGGIKIIPIQFEFWQGRGHRLHDRFRYSQTDEATRKTQTTTNWQIDRLAP